MVRRTTSSNRWDVAIAIAVIAVIADIDSFADTATITFACGTGRLDLKVSGAGNLTASGGRGVFTGPNITMLSDGNGVAESSSGTVTVTMSGFTPSAVDDSGLTIRITDGSTTITATVIDLFDDDFPDVLITDGSDTDSAEFFAPNSGTNFMTLEYDPVSDTATVTIQGFGGNTAELSDINLGTVQMGVQAANNQANFDTITFTGQDVPLFPPVFDPANPWVDFGADPCGNGAQGYPFDLLADAVAAADPGATVSIVPGTDGAETFTDAGAINAALTLTNSDSGSGAVRIGVVARRAGPAPSKTGFVSRPRP